MRQGDPHPEPAGELCEGPGEVLLGETKARQDAFGLMLRVQAPMRRIQRSGRGCDIAEMFLEILREVANPQSRALADTPAVQRLLS